MITNTVDIEVLTGKVKRKYWLFSTGFVVFGLATAVSIGFYNAALGVAALMAELTYFSYVNMITVSDIKHRLNLAEQYTKKLAELPADDKTEKLTGGQYL